MKRKRKEITKGSRGRNKMSESESCFSVNVKHYEWTLITNLTLTLEMRYVI